MDNSAAKTFCDRLVVDRLLVSVAFVQWHREWKCADTSGTLLVPRAGHFQCWNINIFVRWNIRKQFYRTALGNCYGLKLPNCRSQFKKQIYCFIRHNFRHTCSLLIAFMHAPVGKIPPWTSALLPIYMGWQWRNVVPYLCQLVSAAIL